MPKPTEDQLRIPESLQLLEGTVSKAKIKRIFNAIRDEGQATRQLAKVRQTEAHPSGDVLWSLWIGKRKKTPAWYAGPELEDVRHLFVLILEHRGFIALASSMAGSVKKHLGLPGPTYESILAMKDLGSVEFSELRSEQLTTAQSGVFATTTRGRSLQRTMSRAAARRAVPAGLKFDDGDAHWRITPTTGRIGRSGGRVTLKLVCTFFAELVEDILKPPERTPGFVDAYATPLDFAAIGPTLTPATIRLDASTLEGQQEGACKLTDSEGKDLSEDGVAQLRKDLETTWTLEPKQTTGSPKWTLKADGRTIGVLVRGSADFRLNSPYLHGIHAVDVATDESTSLKKLMNDATLPFMVSFTKPSCMYYVGRLFQDQRIVGEAKVLLQVIDGLLPNADMGEKTETANPPGFADDSLFGFVEGQCANHAYLVCEDMGSELADYISIDDGTVTFWHCKSKSPAVGASGLHEVVAQAVKNLGFLHAEEKELRAKEVRWNEDWQKKAGFPRLRKGVDVSGFISALRGAIASPNYRPTVTLVVGGLSRAGLETAFDALEPDKAAPANVTQALWLLSMFVDCCRAHGAAAKVICSP